MKISGFYISLKGTEENILKIKIYNFVHFIKRYQDDYIFNMYFAE